MTLECPRNDTVSELKGQRSRLWLGLAYSNTACRVRTLWVSCFYRLLLQYIAYTVQWCGWQVQSCASRHCVIVIALPLLFEISHILFCFWPGAYLESTRAAGAPGLGRVYFLYCYRSQKFLELLLFFRKLPKYTAAFVESHGQVGLVDEINRTRLYTGSNLKLEYFDWDKLLELLEDWYHRQKLVGMVLL